MSDYFIHKKAIVETKNIGTGSKIWAFAHVLPGAKIGKNVNICDHCFIENDVEIGDDVTIKSGVYLWDGLRIEDKVHIGPAAVFTNDLFPRSKNINYKQEKTVLKKGCSIGANATILPGHTIGCYAMVGAGSVVTKDMPDFALVYGNPAVVHGSICVCGKKMVFEEDTCKCSCGKEYKMINSEVKLIKE
jgi:acetyltransferase-like isoleucine patch superfamily enzyme